MKIFIDFETRSEVNIRARGAYVYGEDDSADVLCLAVKTDSDLFLWTPESGGDKELEHIIQSATEIHAHNAQFESIIWRNVMVKKYGFKPVPDDKWVCTAAKAAYHALPRSLANAGKALDLSEIKSVCGNRLIRKLCVPRADGTWCNDKELLSQLYDYCLQDVEAESAIDKALRDLPAAEQKVWLLDQEINQRGICLDMGSIQRMIDLIAIKEPSLIAEFKAATNGEVDSPRQGAKTIEWLGKKGIEARNLTKGTVTKLLATDLDADVRRALEIRSEINKTSVAKYSKMKEWCCKDGRVRGSLLYHGASTGRWSGMGIQPQNYARGSLKGEEDSALFIAHVGELSDVEETYGSIMEVASSCLRSVLVAGEGNTFYCGDFSQIEARVNAWLSGEVAVTDAYIRGLDLYKVAASGIFAVDYEDVTPDQRQVGKAAELALGFGGGIGAFATMAEIYNVDMDTMVEPVMAAASKWQKELAGNTATSYFAGKKRALGKEEYEAQAEDMLTREQAIACDIIKQKWRDNRPNIKKFWAGLEDAAVKAISTGKPFSYSGVTYGTRDNFLHARLPSGRLLSYYAPELNEVDTPWGDKKEAVTYMAVDSMTHKWRRHKSYGGKLVENVVQAVARDFMVAAMFRLTEAGFPIVLTIHDEVLCEVPLGEDRFEEFINCMKVPPDWAVGCPIDAGGWQGKRYRKD